MPDHDDPDRTRDLVAEARAGRREAFDALLAPHRSELERALRGRVPKAVVGRVDVSDVVQDALCDAFDGFETFEYRGAGSLGRWLRTIAENRLKMALARHLGSAQRDAAREEPLASEAGPLSQTSPSAAAARDERGDLVRASLAGLSDDHREVLRLVRLEGRSIPEAAAALGRSENAVKKLLARALIELGSRLPKGAQP